MHHQHGLRIFARIFLARRERFFRRDDEQKQLHRTGGFQVGSVNGW